MAGLFKLIPRSIDAGNAFFSVCLDEREAYLADHRPGGEPLFSTVMAIETSVIGARCFVPRSAWASVSCVAVHKPFIVSGDGPRVLDLHVGRKSDAGKLAFQCTLSSTRDGRASHHLEATVHFNSATYRTSSSETKVSTPFSYHPQAGPLINGAKVYELFFHGPSYQVIGEAQYMAGQMLCSLKQGIPASHRHTGSQSAMAPRVIEFALQTAGLLEIAVNKRMMIPHSIESIERLLPVDVVPSAMMLARASYGPGDEPSINIEIHDESGRPALVVTAYRTVDLPFAVPAAPVARLHAQLRGI